MSGPEPVHLKPLRRAIVSAANHIPAWRSGCRSTGSRVGADMRIFLAGATGVIGIRLVPRLAAGGHQVAGMTRSADEVARLRALGAEPVVCDVYDADALRTAVSGFH